MKRTTTLLLALVVSLTASGCELVGDLLEFGFWMLVILVLVVAAASWGLFRMIARKGGRRPPPR